jgi:hypothetical protein
MLRTAPRTPCRILSCLVAAFAAGCQEHFPQPIAAEMADAALADDATATDELPPLEASMADEADAIVGADTADDASDGASGADATSDP